MAGLIFFWQGVRCIEYVPENPFPPGVSFLPKQPVVGYTFMDKVAGNVVSFTPRNPTAVLGYAPRVGSMIQYGERIDPPDCKHD